MTQRDTHSMNKFRFLLFLSIVGCILFFLCLCALTAAFVLTFYMDKLVLGSGNIWISRWFILAGAIFSLVVIIINISTSVRLSQMMKDKKIPMVGELIYILGIEYIGDKKPSRSSTPSPKTPPVRPSPPSTGIVR